MVHEALAEDPAYLDKHLIPPNPDLWKLDRFEGFITGRQKLIRQRFGHLLSTTNRLDGGR